LGDIKVIEAQRILRGIPSNTFENRDKKIPFVLGPIVKLNYCPPFKIDDFRWVWLSAILKTEKVSFMVQGKTYEGYVTECKLEGSPLIPSRHIIFLKIHLTEVSFNE